MLPCLLPILEAFLLIKKAKIILFNTYMCRNCFTSLYIYNFYLWGLTELHMLLDFLADLIFHSLVTPNSPLNRKCP